MTDLAAFLPKPVPFPSSASAVPSPAKAYLDVTRAPALRFFAVCAPVCRDGTTSRRFPAATRRRRRAVGRARDCAPPHCKEKEDKVSSGYAVCPRGVWNGPRILGSRLLRRLRRPLARSRAGGSPTTSSLFRGQMMWVCSLGRRWRLTVAVVPSVLQLPYFCPQPRPQRLEGGAVVHVLYL